MTVTLSPEQERRLADILRSGAYQNAEQVLDHALEMLLAQEEWLAENRGEIAAVIELGYAEAERGELMDGDEVRSRMARERTPGWLRSARREWLPAHTLGRKRSVRYLVLHWVKTCFPNHIRHGPQARYPEIT
jgi:Arc/MetJ-type ribon-helix-helix transcriptional regulator